MTGPQPGPAAGQKLTKPYLTEGPRRAQNLTYYPLPALVAGGSPLAMRGAESLFPAGAGRCAFTCTSSRTLAGPGVLLSLKGGVLKSDKNTAITPLLQSTVYSASSTTCQPHARECPGPLYTLAPQRESTRSNPNPTTRLPPWVPGSRGTTRMCTCPQDHDDDDYASSSPCSSLQAQGMGRMAPCIELSPKLSPRQASCLGACTAKLCLRLAG